MRRRGEGGERVEKREKETGAKKEGDRERERERESNVSRLRFFEQLLWFCFAAAAKKANYAAAYINHLAGCVCVWEAQCSLAWILGQGRATCGAWVT